MALPSFSSLNGYTVIARHKMDWAMFRDTNHIYNALGTGPFIDHLGLVAPFNQYGLVNTPILNMVNAKKSTLYLNNLEGKFRFNIPYKRGLPYIVTSKYTENLTYPGKDDAPFYLSLSEPFTPGDVITTDIRNAPSLVVTEDEVEADGSDGYRHTVKLAVQNKKHTYYPKKYLKPTSQYMKIDQAMGEFTEQGTSITSQRLGWLEVEANLGSGEKKVEHWVTMHGSVLSMYAKDALAGKIQDYNLDTAGSVLAFYNKNKEGKTIPGSLGWAPAIDAAVLSELYTIQELAMSWGKGGDVTVSGRKSIRLSLGWYEQLRTGNRLPYTKGRLKLPDIDAAIARLYRGTGIPIEQRETTLDCGSGFLNEISKLILLEATSKNIGIINTDQLGIVSGKDPMNLEFGYRFTSFRFPNAGMVRFRLNQAFDNEYGLRNTDGLYGEFPDYSYSAAIFDVTDSRATNSAKKFNENDISNATDFNKNANIYMVKPRSADGDYWGYIAGTVNPFGLEKTKGFAASSSKPGYGIFAYNFGNIWIKDPSRTLLIEVENSGNN